MTDLTIDIRRLRPVGWAATVSDENGHILGSVNVRRWQNGREHLQIVRAPISIEPAALVAIALALRGLRSDASYADAADLAEQALEQALSERGNI